MLTRLVVAPINAFGAGFVAAIVGINRWIQRGVLRRLAVVGVLVGVSVGVSWALWPKVEYLPTGNRNLVFGILLPPPGYNLDKLMELGETVEDGLRPYWDVDPESPEAKKLDVPGDRRLLLRGPRPAGVLGPAGLRSESCRASSCRSGADGRQQIARHVRRRAINRACSSGACTAAARSTSKSPARICETGRLGRRRCSGRWAVMPASCRTAQASPVPSLDLSSPEVHVVPEAGAGRRHGASAARTWASPSMRWSTARTRATITSRRQDRPDDHGPAGRRRAKVSPNIAGHAGHRKRCRSPRRSASSCRSARWPTSSSASGPEQINHRERRAGDHDRRSRRRPTCRSKTR